MRHEITFLHECISASMHDLAPIYQRPRRGAACPLCYRGNLYSDLLSGQVQVSFVTIISSVEYIRAGKLRTLGVTTAKRAEALPDVPTIGEFVSGYEASGWYGIGAPKGTSPEIIERLNKEIDTVVADPKMKARFAGLGVESMSMTPAEFAKFIANETEKWLKVVKFARIKPA
jgi:tripartite-type tricarboxylate transporter receptor subunit TctC